MFFAMNRFQVNPGYESDFEDNWRRRERHLDEVPGFLAFHLLKGEAGIYLSHSTWESRQAFEAWTQSEAFRKAHSSSPGSKSILSGPPQLSVYDEVDLEPTT